jgi:hypothetical protein
VLHVDGGAALAARYPIGAFAPAASTTLEGVTGVINGDYN